MNDIEKDRLDNEILPILREITELFIIINNTSFGFITMRIVIHHPLKTRMRKKVSSKNVSSQENEEECESCSSAVGVGMALSICNSLGYIDCNELYDKVINEERDADTVVDILIERTEGKKEHKEEHKTLIELKRMMHTPLKELEEGMND